MFRIEAESNQKNERAVSKLIQDTEEALKRPTTLSANNSFGTMVPYLNRLYIFDQADHRNLCIILSKMWAK